MHAKSNPTSQTHNTPNPVPHIRIQQGSRGHKMQPTRSRRPPSCFPCHSPHTGNSQRRPSSTHMVLRASAHTMTQHHCQCTRTRTADLPFKDTTQLLSDATHANTSHSRLNQPTSCGTTSTPQAAGTAKHLHRSLAPTHSRANNAQVHSHHTCKTSWATWHRRLGLSHKDAIKHKAAFNDQGEATAMYGHASSTPLLLTCTLHFHLHNSLHIPLLASSLCPFSPSHPDYGSQAPDACDNDSNVTSNGHNDNLRSPSACTNGPHLMPLTARGRVGSMLTTRLHRQWSGRLEQRKQKGIHTYDVDK
jgi:hypothetical protein